MYTRVHGYHTYKRKNQETTFIFNSKIKELKKHLQPSHQLNTQIGLQSLERTSWWAKKFLVSLFLKRRSRFQIRLASNKGQTHHQTMNKYIIYIVLCWLQQYLADYWWAANRSVNSREVWSPYTKKNKVVNLIGDTH